MTWGRKKKNSLPLDSTLLANLAPPRSADVPDADSPGQRLLPLGVPPHHRLALLSQQQLQVRVDAILKERKQVFTAKLTLVPRTNICVNVILSPLL